MESDVQLDGFACVLTLSSFSIYLTTTIPITEALLYACCVSCKRVEELCIGQGTNHGLPKHSLVFTTTYHVR